METHSPSTVKREGYWGTNDYYCRQLYSSLRYRYQETRPGEECAMTATAISITKYKKCYFTTAAFTSLGNMRTMGSRKERDVDCFPIFATYFHSCGRYYRIHLIEGMYSIGEHRYLLSLTLLHVKNCILSWVISEVYYASQYPRGQRDDTGIEYILVGSHCFHHLPFILLPWIIVNITEANSSPNLLRLA